MRKLLIISFDALGDSFFPAMLKRPRFAQFAKECLIRRGADSVAVTNTYPVHTSVVTGVTPAAHGLASNSAFFPRRFPQWNYRAEAIQTETLWHAAAAQKRSVASVMWPVTGGARAIRWNIPELMKQPGENQVLLNLRYGSKALQLFEVAKHFELMRGIPKQPYLDRFATAAMADILRGHKPDLALLHLTIFDYTCHEHGLSSPKPDEALDELDISLGIMLDAIQADTDVIVFSDHAQLPVHEHVLLNEHLRAKGLLEAATDGAHIEYIENSGMGCYFASEGGVAFLHAGRLSPAQIEALRAQCTAMPCTARLLTKQELADCGHAQFAFGLAAKPGYSFDRHANAEMANHGYPPSSENYKVFYMARGAAYPPGTETGGSLLDIAPMGAQSLGISFTPGKPMARQ